ncbi:MAG TPA: adenosylcobalamin-dependent ribonucleoside-diphosphate reductase [Dehalococcoidia bacterium]|nr:adenosylcobalamin-dependent ribonucleoside-diphosphate reductase [Dehalococcoidia bacterium]
MVIESNSRSGKGARRGGARLSLSENARVVLERRYLAKDDDGQPIETPEQLFRRVAGNLAQAERNYGADDARLAEVEELFYRTLTSLDFLPNSPTLGNAGRPLQQLSACFVLPVEDSIDRIFDTIRATALVHQSGGGCIAGDARVWTTFCGIEPIEVLFNRATVDGRSGERYGAGIVYDVGDLGIQTLSMNPQSGETGLRPVTHVWRFEVPAAEQLVIRLRDGAEVQTSAWHPFMAVRGTQLVEVRADRLTPGDIVLGPDRPDSFWPWSEPRSAGSLSADADLGWLIGFTLGDGSFGYAPALRQYRVRWFSGSEDVLERVRTILARHGIHVSIARDRRGLLSVATLNQRFVHDLLEACGLETFGAKDGRIRVPELIAKSPLAVVRAFVAGLLDSDGYVDSRGHVSYSTVSAAMADDLAALLSLLGFHPGVASKAPHGKGKRTIYTVRVGTTAQVPALAGEIAPYMANDRRRTRILNAPAGQGALRLPFHAWRDALAALGLAGRRGPGVASPFALDLSHWSCNERERVSRVGLERIAVGLTPHNPALATLLQRVARHGFEVESVARAAVAKPYYDLTVDGWNTYAAGRSGLAMIHNTGFAFSRLRPEGSLVRSTSGVASGPVSFMKVFDASTEAIKQGGTRRGANMGILAVDHPDIEKFIECKADMVSCTNFNISVAVTEKFMQAAERGEAYELVDPHTGQVTGTRNAREIFDKLVANAWQNGDPGIVFIDRINAGRANPVPKMGPIESTNPCGEQPLYPYDSCNLGSINLAKFVVRRGEERVFDYERLGEVVPVCVRFLDNVIDMNKYPLPEIEDVSHRIRRIGLGVMGFADACMKLNIPYDSEEAVTFAEEVMGFIQQRADQASGELARERGTFPEWDGSIYNMSQRYPERPRLRNATRTTIAPTGTLSIIADCSGGVEPVFALAFTRQHYLDRNNPTQTTKLTEVNDYFAEVARREGFYSPELMDDLAAGGHLADHAEVPDWVKRVFVTAHDIAPEWHVRIQAAFQRHTDNAVSKTINFGNEATVEDVARAYRLAYEEGCLGITIYRDGSRALQVLSHEPAKTGTAAGEAVPAVPAEPARPRRERLPDERQSITHKFAVGEQEGFLTVGLYEDGRPGEIFIKVSKQGSTVSGLMDTIALLMSMAMQYGVPMGSLLDKLKNSRFEPYGMTRNHNIPTATSLVDYIARYLELRFITGQQAALPMAGVPGVPGVQAALPLAEGYAGTEGATGYTNGNGNGNGHYYNGKPTVSSGVGCPECGSVLQYAEGCLICRGCGYTKCG